MYSVFVLCVSLLILSLSCFVLYLLYDAFLNGGTIESIHLIIVDMVIGTVILLDT